MNFFLFLVVLCLAVLAWQRLELAKAYKGKKIPNAKDRQLLKVVNTGIVQDIIDAINKGADVNIKDSLGNTPLMTAAHHANIDAVNVLLENGADVNARNDSGISALMFAVKYAASYALANAFFLADFKAANVNSQDTGSVNVQINTWGGNVKNINVNNMLKDEDVTKLVKVLLKAGADVNISDTNGESALINAAKGGNAELVNTLLNAGGNAKQQDVSGKTALDYAHQNKKLEGTDALKRLGELSR